MRALGLFLLAVLLLLSQSVLHTLVPSPAPLPALALLCPLYAAFSPRWSLPGTVVFASLCGYCFDLASGAPVGMHAFATPVVALVAAALGTRLQIRGPFARAVAAFVFTLAAGALIAGLRRWLPAASGASGATGGALRGLPLSALLSAAVAPPIFAIVDRIERRFDRSAVRVGRPGGGRLDTGIELSR